MPTDRARHDQMKNTYHAKDVESALGQKLPLHPFG